MDAKPIENEADYEAALKIVAGLMTANPGTPEGDALDRWAAHIEDYEDRVHPIDPPGSASNN